MNLIPEVISVGLHQYYLIDLRHRLNSVRKESRTIDPNSHSTINCDFTSDRNHRAAERKCFIEKTTGVLINEGNRRATTGQPGKWDSEEIIGSSVTEIKYSDVEQRKCDIYKNVEVMESDNDESQQDEFRQFQASSDPEESGSLDLVTDSSYVPQYNYQMSDHPVHKSHWNKDEIKDVIMSLWFRKGDSISESLSYDCSSVTKLTSEDLADDTRQKQSRKRKAPPGDDTTTDVSPAKRVTLMMSM